MPTEETPEESDKPDPLVGFVLTDKYELLSSLGGGGAGLVYKARHLYLQKVVAIKIMFPHLSLNEVKVQRFKQEALIMSQLSHPNIVGVIDFGQAAKGEPYIVMDCLEGETLSEVLDKDGAMPVERALPILLQTCDALVYAHSKGLIHRDLKPSNIMLVTTPEGKEAVKLIDFGLVKQFIDSDSIRLTQTGEVFGSPYYMAPEQIRAEKVDARTDVYAMGIVIYETLTGMLPFSGDDAHTVFKKQLTADPGHIAIDAPSVVRDQLELIILKALAKEPERRFQDMESLRDALLQVNQQPQSLDRTRTLWNLVAMRCQNYWNSLSKSIVGLVAMVAILISAVAVLFYTFVVPHGVELDPDKTITWQAASNVVHMDPNEMRDQDLMAKLLLNSMYKEKDRDTARYADALNKQGVLYLETGRYDKAESTFKELIGLRQILAGKGSVAVIDALNNLATCYYNQQRYDEAQPLYEEGIVKAQTVFGQNDLELAQPLSNQSDIYGKKNDLLQAESMARRALAIWKNEGMENSPESLITQSRLADYYYAHGRSEEAQVLYKDLLHKWKKFEGAQFQNAAVCLQRLASIAQRNNNSASAIDLYKQELQVLEKSLNPDSPKIAAILQKLAQLQWQQGHWIDAMQSNSKANSILTKSKPQLIED